MDATPAPHATPAPPPSRSGLWVLGVLAVCLIGLVVSLRFVGRGVLPAAPAVAVLPVEGVITGERDFLDQLERFRDDGGIRAFVLEIESPGGVVGASQSIYDGVRALREEDDRPVLAWMGDVAASGGYYVALGADSIFALPGTITGSIGVILEFPNAEELLEKIGVDLEVVKSGEHKDMGSFARDMSESDRAIFQSVIDDTHAQFVEAVSSNRPLTPERAAELADGRIYSGRQAVEVGLVDRNATLDEVIALAGRMAGIGSDPRVQRPYEPRIGLWDVVFGISETRARRLLERALTARRAPRLLYEWR